MPDTLLQLFDTPTVIPVVTVDDAATAVQIATALNRGGLNSIEVTLRTEGAMTAATAVREQVSGIKLGLGTVTRTEQLARAKDIGADFAVSPGLDENLVRTARELGLPYLPGIYTPSELEGAMALDCDAVKVFPAGQAGGPAYIRQLASIFPQVRFCPTGGLNAENLREYLNVPGVFCAGGSWLAPKAAMENQDWSAIQALARAAAEICTLTTDA